MVSDIPISDSYVDDETQSSRGMGYKMLPLAKVKELPVNAFARVARNLKEGYFPKYLTLSEGALVTHKSKLLSISRMIKERETGNSANTCAD